VFGKVYLMQDFSQKYYGHNREEQFKLCKKIGFNNNIEKYHLDDIMNQEKKHMKFSHRNLGSL
jgi:hypothetical protein